MKLEHRDGNRSSINRITRMIADSAMVSSLDEVGLQAEESILGQGRLVPKPNADRSRTHRKFPPAHNPDQVAPRIRPDEISMEGPLENK